ncbi:hypothetical protein ACOQLP_31610, partial [Klebsiella pneumoniae]|uniref:hypothetical protein n=3 Tax=Klebsiella/Raoultella group TaxID=2890311 RepID=UPI00301B5316
RYRKHAPGRHARSRTAGGEMMPYFFLIFVISSQSSNMQVVPMQSMEQCKAAIKAMKVADDKRSWDDVSPSVDNVQCVEVKGA